MRILGKLATSLFLSKIFFLGTMVSVFFFFITASVVLGADGQNQTVKLINPLGGKLDNPVGVTSTPKILGNLIAKSLTVLGSITLLVFVFGGWEWLASSGNPEKIKKGTHIMGYAGLGLLIIFISYGILSAFLKSLGAKGFQADTGQTSGGNAACYCGSSTWYSRKEIVPNVLGPLQCQEMTGQSLEEFGDLVDCEWKEG